MHLFYREASATFTGHIVLMQRSLIGVRCDFSQGPGAEDADPHFEISRFAHQHMILSGVEPDQVTAAHMILFVIQQIYGRALGDEVELQFNMAMHGVVPVLKAVIPEIAVP